LKERVKTKKIYVGNVAVGGDAPISVQSMTYSDTHNVAATVEQINRLHFAGADMVRVAVPDMEDALALKAIKEQISLPLIADIHFNYKLALEAAKWVDCIRFNPGNIGEKSRIKEIVKACQERSLPIRIGVNAGSLEKEFEDRYGATAEGMVASAEYNIKFLEDLGFTDIKVSLKASDVDRTVDAYRMLRPKNEYPFHLGVTEAGTIFHATIKSAIGLGTLLLDGIGDTMRVSITGELEEEIKVGKAILKDSGRLKEGLNIISCPTCGRIEADLVKAVAEVERRTAHIKTPMDVSVMGCVVNAIGEAKHADVAIAYGKGAGLVMLKGEVVIFDPETYEEIAAKLMSHDFYLPFHQHVFASMEELSREEKPIDEEFLRSKLIAMGKFDEVAMLDLLSANPISNTAAYLTEIKAKSSKRALATLATEIKKVVIEDDLPAEEVMNLVEKKLYEITQNNTNEDFRDSKDITLAMMDEINRLKALGNSKLIGTDTGFKNLNDKTSGFGKGDLVIIAARPAMGKTALVLNMALKAIERNEGVAFFSLEMPAEQLMLRLLSAKTSIPLQALRVGDLRDEQWSQLSAATSELSEKKLFVDDGGYATIHHVRSKLRKLKAQHPEISVAIIDYLQLMSGEGKEGRQQEVSEISRGLKQLARELQIPIVALSQLNRGVESRDNKRPMLSDLRESGAIEQDADIILFVYRDDVYREAMEKEKEMKAKAEGKPYTSEFSKKSEEDAEIIIGKQRNGPTGTVFQKKFTRFVDASVSPAFEVVYEESDMPMQEANINIELPTI